MIIYENVTKIYPGDTPALDGVTLHIKEAEFVSVVGHSGAGKSTLLKLLYAEEKPTTGRIWFNRKNINIIKNRYLPYHRRQIGTVFQDFKLLSKRTLFENVSFAMEVAGKTDEEIEESVPKILDIVGLKNKMEKYPKEISGGEQQRVALARAFVNRPKVIVADEPTGNLDPISTWEIIQLLLKINQLGTTIILATHNKSIVDKIRKRVIAVDKGRIISDKEKGRYCI